MEWVDRGYVLAQKNFSEQALILDIFTENHGRARGIIKGSKRKFLNTLQIGIGGKVLWKARLAEHLGTFQIDPQFNLLPFLYLNPSKLTLFQAFTRVLCFVLPENQPYPSFFLSFEKFLTKSLLKTNALELAKDYIHLEKDLLDVLGFGLDISRCAITGSRQNLYYVSPRTGKACTKTAGAPYEDMLLKLPCFLTDSTVEVTKNDIKSGLHLTGYFLEKHFFSQKQKGFLKLRENITQSLI